jgi:hypothetical protein
VGLVASGVEGVMGCGDASSSSYCGAASLEWAVESVGELLGLPMDTG